MNVLVQPTIADLPLAPGEWITLEKQDTAYLIQAGEVELYATLWDGGALASRRLFLFALGAGDLIAPGFYSNGTLKITALAASDVSLLPVPAGFLQKIAATAERGPVLAAQINRWLGGLGSIMRAAVGPIPSDAQSVTPGETVALTGEAFITAHGGPSWLAAKNAGFTYPDGHPVESIEGVQVAPLLPGLWLKSASPATAYLVPSQAAIQQSLWLPALHAQHVYILDCVARVLTEGRAESAALALRRRERSELAIERTIDRFAGILEHAPAWTGAAAPGEAWLGPFVMVCETLGIDLTGVQRDAIGQAGTMDDAARAARLRQRQIALRGDWWRQDFGPLIGLLGDDRRPCAILPSGAGRMRLVDPGGGPDQIVTARIAARLQPMAHMLYRPLATKPVKLRDLVTLGWKQASRDIYVAVAASFAISLLGLATPLAMRLAFDRFIPSHETLPLVELAIGLALAALITMGFRTAYDMASLRIDGRMAGATQAAVVDRVLRLPAAALRFGSADLAQRVMAADSVRRTLVNFGLSSMAALFSLIMNGTLLIYYAPLGALIAWVAFAVLLLLAWFVATKQMEAIRRGAELLSNVNTIIFHFVKGIGVLRAAGAEDKAFARWGRDFAEMRARAYRSQSMSTLFETSLAGFDVLSMAGVFFVLSTMPQKDLSIGSFMSFVASYGIFMASAIQLSRGLLAVLNTAPNWERASPLLKSVPENYLTKRNPGKLSGAVEMTNIAFRYGPELPFVLSGFSLKVRAGEFVALVGVSGSGKSTIMQLLLGNLRPLAGTVQYDDVDLSHFDIELVRRQIGVVLQSGRLLPGTIFENIMGSHHGTIDDAWEAARQAGLDAEIKSFPMGMHTVLTEATAAFSGGQVQRIMLARALAGQPPILLLDEATSALDNITQAAVTASLAKLAVTRVVIAHRLVTVRQADRICVIDGGRVVQSGTYDELTATKGLFSELAKRQLL